MLKRTNPFCLNEPIRAELKFFFSHFFDSHGFKLMAQSFGLRPFGADTLR